MTTTLATRHEKNITPIKLDPAWDLARDLLAEGRSAASNLAAEIGRLRELYLQPAGLRRGSESQSVIQKNSGGFQAQLRDQLGLHPQQAARIEEAASYQLRIEQVASAEIGEVVEWDESGERKTLTVTAAHKECAGQVADGLSLPGAPRPSRAWAGIVGEGTRVGYGAGSKERATPDHLGLWVKASATIRRIGPHWEKLFRPGDRSRAIDELSSALASLPKHAREAIVAAATAEANTLDA